MSSIRNALLAWPNLTLGTPEIPVTVTSGPGCWVDAGDVRLANLLNEDLGAMARTASTDPATAYVDYDLGAAMELALFALPKHNLERSGDWRVQVGSWPGASNLADSGPQPVEGLSFAMDTQPAESHALFEGVVGSDWTAQRSTAFWMPPARITGRYVRVWLIDPGNADGFLQMPMVWMSGGLQPRFNASWGMQYGWLDPESAVAENEDGSEDFLDRPRRRSVEFALDFLTEAEAELQHEMLRSQGVGGLVAFVPDATDHQLAQRYGVLGLLSELPQHRQPYIATTSVAYRIEEV